MTGLSMSSAPLFVLGKHRSGTTWLATELSQHPAIAAVREHDGNVVESLFFSQLAGRYGDLRRESNRRELVEVIAASRYAHAGEISREALDVIGGSTYAAFFREMMDDFARRRGARYWLEKSPGHTADLRALAGAYPDARFVGIVRSPREVIASTLAHHAQRHVALRGGPRRTAMIIRLSWTWSFYEKCLRDPRLAGGRMYVTTYHELTRDRERVLRDICSFLDLDFDDALLVSSARRNSSFTAPCSRDRALSPKEVVLIDRAVGVFSHVPHRALLALSRPMRALRRRRPLPRWFFVQPHLEAGAENPFRAGETS